MKNFKNFKINLCLEGIGASWYEGANTFPSRGELIQIFTDFIWKYIDYTTLDEIKKVENELEITLLPISDPGQEVLAPMNCNACSRNTPYTVKEYAFPIYYLEISSSYQSLIDGIREDLDYRKHITEDITEEDLDYLKKYYYCTSCSGNVLYLHYIPEGTSLEEHKKLIKSKYNYISKR